MTQQFSFWPLSLLLLLLLLLPPTAKWDVLEQEQEQEQQIKMRIDLNDGTRRLEPTAGAPRVLAEIEQSEQKKVARTGELTPAGSFAS